LTPLGQGGGAVALAAIMAARIVGCGPIIAVDIMDHRLALAEELGTTHILNGAAALGTEVSFEMSSILFGRTVRGIMQGDCAPDVFVPQLIDFWRQGRFPFYRLIKFYDLDDLNEAVRASESGAVTKPVVRTGRR
jgi:aryl-alcohol dehydrogenase